MSQNGEKLVEVKNLQVYFPIRKGLLRRTVGHVKAVENVSFDIALGTTLGLVGESGCGKTTVGRSMLGLVPATGGQVMFNGQNVFDLSPKEMKKIRRDLQLVFQDPYGSLNPRMTVEEIVGEPMLINNIAKDVRRSKAVGDLLEKVGLSRAYINRYPHEFSGGQRQRIGIARALALNPQLVICDEPVSALDVSIQSQIINLLKDLQRELGLTYLFIAHDLAVVEHISDWVAVMYLGNIVEYASRDELFGNPLHPYTRALFSAIPRPDPAGKKQRTILSGEVPSPSNPPSGCPFHPRCQMAERRCEVDIQTLTQKSTDNKHLSACWKVEN
jgi:oligopeptide/dipeptide ABC transporter ATP-binding protein